MKAVGIKVLKNNLSRYLRYVRDGEIVYVTDRDTVVAEIHRPARAVLGRVDRWEAFLNEEELRGSIRRACVGKGPSLAGLFRLSRPKRRIDLQRLLDEVKSD